MYFFLNVSLRNGIHHDSEESWNLYRENSGFSKSFYYSSPKNGHLTKKLKSYLLLAIEPTTPMSIYDRYAQLGGTFYFTEELEMRAYEKRESSIPRRF